MSALRFLVGASLLLAQVFADRHEVPLLPQSSESAPRPSFDTWCPAPLQTVFHLDLLWISESKESKICPKELKVDGDFSIGMPSYQRDCIKSGGSSSVYCLYVFSGFARGRGLAIIASPSVASNVRSALSALDPLHELERRDHFFEKALPGRGKGLISNYTFKKGDLILSSTPVFMIQERAMIDMNRADRLLLQRLSISALPIRSRGRFYDLAGHFGGDQTEDILLTNGFSATFGVSQESFGIVVPEAARLNHDCRPNARFAFDSRTFVHKVHATRTIEPGEELTFSYIDEKQIYAARQHHIKEHWGFDCQCRLCSSPEQLRNISDTRLQRIAVLRKYLFLFTAENYRNVTPDMALELISLYEEEGLNGALAEAYMVTALWYCIWGNVHRTKKYAALAVGNWLVVSRSRHVLSELGNWY
ncbi:SET domain-containing protein 5 [Cadophora gregata f. sp. sojae]|nr:SET domain-containing protein 5 [Cadophora gregata f. sp. sojae]